ncbi:MAG: carboxypeptidase regulatory-like domain-containing protein [Candidatus Margulisbacteria bacterium]|jgi:hypothetical protein|nr:carboxypeptidase regulatory-like domain-containing protein [Candidatus Margulisiibacteriota bacterium]
MFRKIYKYFLPFLFFSLLFNAAFAAVATAIVTNPALTPSTKFNVLIIDAAGQIIDNYPKTAGGTGIDKVTIGVSGNYRVGIYVPGQTIASYAHHKQTYASADLVNFPDVFMQSSYTTANFTIPSSVYNISGKVTLSGQTDHSGIAVNLFEAAGLHWVTSSMTAADGSYSFAGLHGDYFVKAEKNNYFPLFYAGLNGRVTINAAGTYDFTLPAAGSISGAITNGSGGKVTAFLNDGKFTHVSDTTNITSGGAYSLPVPAGSELIVLASKSGYVDRFYNNVYDAGADGKKANPVQSGNGAVNITLEAAGQIKGTLTSSGTGAAEVTLFEKAGNELKYLSGIKNASAPASWTYTLDNAPRNASRPLVIKASKAGHLDRYYVASGAGTYELDKATAFTFSAAGKTGVDITLQEAINMDGNITRTAGAGLVTVNIYQKSGDVYTYVSHVTVNAAAAATTYPAVRILKNVPQVVQAMSAGHLDRYYLSGAPGVYDREKAGVINQAGNASNVNITLEQAVTVAGRIAGLTGAGLTEVVLFEKSGNTLTYLKNVTANATTSWDYELPAPVNSARQLVVKAGKAGYLDRYYGGAAGTYELDKATVFTLPNTTKKENVNITLQAAVTISGSITNGSGATVNVFERSGSPPNYVYTYVNNVQASSTGTYNMQILSGLSQVVLAEKAGYLGRYFDNTYERDKATPVSTARNDVNIILQETVDISGSITRQGGDGIVTLNVFERSGAAPNYVYTYVYDTTRNAGSGGTGYTGLKALKNVPQVVQVLSAGHVERYYLPGAPGSYDREKAGVLTPVGAVSGVNITLEQSGDITGRLTGAGAAEVVLFEKTGQELNYICRVTGNAANWDYTLKAPRHASRLLVVKASKAGHLDRYYVTGGAGTYELDKATTFNFNDAGKSGVNITLQEAINMDGNITRTAGAGLVTVNIYQKNGDNYTYVNRVTVNAGNNTPTNYPAVKILKGLPQVVQAMSAGQFDRYYLSGAPGVYDRAKATVIDQSGSVSGVSITLYPAVTISGGVSTNTGANLGGVSVSAFVKNTNFEYVNEVTANASGGYSLGIPANSSVILRAVTPGYAEQWYNGKSVSSNADVLNAAQNNVNFKLTPVVSISGRVTAYTGGGSIAGARVTVFTTGNVYVAEAATDANGDYKVPAVPANAGYFVQVTTNGTHFPQWYDRAYGYGDRATLNMGTTSLTGINFVMYTRGVLSGAVKDNGGAPLGGVTVSAFVKGTNYTYAGAQKSADADGSFSLEIPVGVGLVLQAATANQFLGFPGGSWYYNDTTSVVSSADAQVFTGGQSNLTFVLDRRWKVAGRVTLNTGSIPANTGRVELFEWNSGGVNWSGYLGGVTLDASGLYELTGTGNAAFDALLRVSLNNYVTTFYRDKNNVNDLVTVNDRIAVALLTTTNLQTVTLNPGGKISGTVAAVGGSGVVTVNLESTDGKYFTAVTLNSPGAYLLERVPTGQWLVRASQDATVAKYYGDAAATVNARRVTVLAGQTTTNIDVYIAGEWTISGRIYEGVNIPIAGALVEAYFYPVVNGQWQWIATANTDAQGNYTLRNGYSNKRNDPAQVFLQISAPNYTKVTTNPIAVAVNTGYTGHNYALTGAAYIKGTVSSVPPGTAVTVSAFVSGSAWTPAGDEVVLNGGGAYTLTVNANTDLVVRAESFGYKTLWYDGQDTSASAQVINKPVGQTGSGVDFNFAGRDYWLITGSVQDDSGQPLAGLTVNAFVPNTAYELPEGGNTRTGGDGKFVLQILSGYKTNGVYLQAVTANPYIGYPSGAYYVDGSPAIISSENATLVQGGNSSGLTFRVAKFWLVKGTVTPPNIEAVIDMYEYTGADIDWNKNKGWVTASASGQYEIRGTGNVTVNIRAATGNYITESVTKAILQTENTYQYDFTLNLGAEISGWVTANSTGTVTISVQDIDGNWLTYVTRNGTGSYTLPRVPPGVRLVYAQQDGCVAEYYGETAATKNAARITLTAGAITQNINMEIAPEWTISGRVQNSSGQPLGGAEVAVFKKLGDWDSWVGAALTDAQGDYTVTGGYNTMAVYIRVSANGYENQYYDGQYAIPSADPVQMKPGDNFTANFTLRQAWKVTGLVTAADSKQPLPGAQVFLVEFNNTGNILAVYTTDSSGVYEFVSTNACALDLGLIVCKADYVTQNTAAFQVDFAVPVQRDIVLARLEPPVEPLPPGQKMEDTILSGPNPANPDEGPIHIGFILDGYYRVRVKVYTVGGELVFQDDRRFPAGYGEFLWDGDNLYRQRLPNGVYLAYVEIDTGSRRLKKVLKIAILR